MASLLAPFLGSSEDAMDCGVSSECCFLLKHSLSFFEQTINRCQIHIIGFSSQAVLKANVWGFIFPAAFFFFKVKYVGFGFQQATFLLIKTVGTKYVL